MAFNPIGSGSSLGIAVNGTTVTTGSWEHHKSDTLRVTAINADALVAVGVGTTNTAAAGSVFIAKGETVNINTGNPASNRVVGMTTSGTTTTVNFAEGTGCPFYIGQLVSVYTNSAADKHWEFSNKEITSINNTWNTNNTAMTVANDYGVGTGFTAFTGSTTISNTEARDSIRLTAKGCSAIAQHGAVYFQQVQVSGDA